MGDDAGEPPPKRARVDGPPPLLEATACDDHCRDPADVRPHVDDYGRLLPCPTYFEHSPLYNIRMEPLTPQETLEATVTQLGGNAELLCVTMQQINGIHGANLFADGPDGAAKRAMVRLYFELIACFAVISQEAPQHKVNDVHSVELENLEGFLRMLRKVVHPFENTRMSDRERAILVSVAYNGIYAGDAFVSNLRSTMTVAELYCARSAEDFKIGDDKRREIMSELRTLRNAVALIDRAQRTTMDPPKIAIDPDDPDMNKANTVQFVIDLLANSEAILTDVSDYTNVRVALPQRYNGAFYYTYCPSTSVSGALQALRVDKSVSDAYAKCIMEVSKAVHTYNETSQIPFSPNHFVSGQRYVAWRNGVYCCITGIFYYRRNQFDNRMPANWSHFTEELERINDGRVRAMKFIDADMRYYETLVDLLAGWFRRDASEDEFKLHRSLEEKYIDQWQGGNALLRREVETRNVPVTDELAAACDEQERWIQQRLEDFDTWFHDKNALKYIDPLDVRCRAPQKIFGDQHMPRNAYRSWLATTGRCLAGVQGDQTRKGCGAQRFLEGAVGHAIVDKRQFATSLIGVGGCGKSELLNMLQRYMEEPLVGHMSDHKRPIDMFNTIRDKAVVIASDYQTDSKDPSMPSGDIKKAIANESLVNDRLHKDSEIIRFICHFLIATNVQLPFRDRDGDMERRFEHFHFRNKISERNQMFVEGDDRTVEEVFVQEDIDRYLLASTLANKRVLLNVGERSFYRPKDKDFFGVPQYLLDTQGEFVRQQDSLAAFISSLRHNFGYGAMYRNFSCPRSEFIARYHDYCEKYKCEQHKDIKVDEVLTVKYGVRVLGQPQTYHGMSLIDPDPQPENPDDSEVIQAQRHIDPADNNEGFE